MFNNGPYKGTLTAVRYSIYNQNGGETNISPPSGDEFIITETGDFVITETGDRVITE